jgi:hypothetical protein
MKDMFVEVFNSLKEIFKILFMELKTTVSSFLKRDK